MWALKRDFPHLQFSLNGGVMGCYEAAAALQYTEPISSPLQAPTHHQNGLTTHSVNPQEQQNGCLHEQAQSHSDPGQQHQSSQGAGDAMQWAPTRSNSAILQSMHPAGQSEASASTHPEWDPTQSTPAGGAVGAALAEMNGYHSRSEDAGGLEGVMIGRAAYNGPWDCLSDADRAVFGASSNPAQSRRQVTILVKYPVKLSQDTISQI